MRRSTSVHKYLNQCCADCQRYMHAKTVILYVDKMLSQIIWLSEDGVEVKSFGHQKTGC